MVAREERVQREVSGPTGGGVPRRGRERLRILQLVQRPQRRGAEVFAAQLAGAMADSGHDVRTVYLYPSPSADRLALGPADVAFDAREGRWIEALLGFQPALRHKIRELVKELRPDVVHAGGGHTVKYAALCRAGPWPRAVVWRNIGYARDWIRGGARQLFYRRVVLPRIDGVVSVTATSREDFVSLFSPRVPVHHIPTGVDPSSVQPRRSRAEVRRDLDVDAAGPVILFVGSLSEEKRPDRFIDVFARVVEAEPSAVGWIVGAGPLRNALEAQAERTGLLDRVRFLGSRDDVGDLMGAADVLLLTSDTEGLPAVIIEAGLAGLPVVATDVGGIHEVVEHGVSGYLHEPTDEAGLAGAAIDLISSPERRLAVSAAARDYARDNLTIEAVARRYEAFFRTILEADHPSLASGLAGSGSQAIGDPETTAR